MEKERKIAIANELLFYLGINARQLSEKIGLKSPQWYYDILNPKKSNGFSRERAGLISLKWPNINPTYLISGEGTLVMDGDEQPTEESADSVENDSKALDNLVGIVKEQGKQITELIKSNQDLISIIGNLSAKK